MRVFSKGHIPADDKYSSPATIRRPRASSAWASPLITGICMQTCSNLWEQGSSTDSVKWPCKCYLCRILLENSATLIHFAKVPQIADETLICDYGVNQAIKILALLELIIVLRSWEVILQSLAFPSLSGEDVGNVISLWLLGIIMCFAHGL